MQLTQFNEHSLKQRHKYKYMIFFIASLEEWKKIAPLVYPGFLMHMGAFGAVTFFLAYNEQDLGTTYLWGGISALIYVLFYFIIFGAREIMWFFINGLIGILSTYAWLETLAHPFLPAIETGKIAQFESFNWHFHLFPGLLFMLYTFLLRNLVIDVVGARTDDSKTKYVNIIYIILSLSQLGIGFFLTGS